MEALAVMLLSDCGSQSSNDGHVARWFLAGSPFHSVGLGNKKKSNKVTVKKKVDHSFSSGFAERENVPVTELGNYGK